MSLRHVLLDTMVILLENGCAVNVQDDTMSTPIHYACKLGDHKIITMLLQCQEIDAARRNAKGKTPLDECILLSARKLMLDYFAQLQVPLLVSCPLSSLPEDDVKKVLEAKVAKLETQAAQMRDQTQKLQVNLEQSANSLREAERERDHLKQETLRLMEIAENPLAPPAIFHANEM